MPNRTALTIATAALLLELLPRIAAHGDERMDMNMSTSDAPQPQIQKDGQPRSYWAFGEHVTLIYCHIALEILAWVVVLPVGKLSRVD
jgi:hypothetical protein